MRKLSYVISKKPLLMPFYYYIWIFQHFRRRPVEVKVLKGSSHMYRCIIYVGQNMNKNCVDHSIDSFRHALTNMDDVL